MFNELPFGTAAVNREPTNQRGKLSTEFRQPNTDNSTGLSPMSVRGSLTKGQLGFSMPAYAPLFPKPPYYYKNATLMVFKYVTDVSVARMIPDTVELADRPTAGLVFASYPSSNLGPYDEVVLFVDVLFNGRPFQFAAFLYVTTDAAMAAGRKMGGYPKKIARIDFLPGPAQTAVLKHPPVCDSAPARCALSNCKCRPQARRKRPALPLHSCSTI